MSDTPATDHARNAALTLSTVGALVLGVGLGALMDSAVRPLAWPLAGIGLVAHLSGMVGNRRALRDEGHVFAAWETWSYWICWGLIVLGVAAVLWRLAS